MVRNKLLFNVIIIVLICILQQLQLSYDTEKNKILQQSTFLTDTMMQVSFNMSDINSPSNLVTKNPWLKLSNENLVYGFTLQNTSKL